MSMNILRSALIELSQNKPLRAFAENSRIGQKMSGRFIAGMRVTDALQVAQTLNRDGIPVSLDSLGENVATELEAQQSAEIYHQLLDAIEECGLQANVSVKLTQMGMDLDPSIARRIVLRATNTSPEPALLPGNPALWTPPRTSPSLPCPTPAQFSTIKEKPYENLPGK